MATLPAFALHKMVAKVHLQRQVFWLQLRFCIMDSVIHINEYFPI